MDVLMFTSHYDFAFHVIHVSTCVLNHAIGLLVRLSAQPTLGLDFTNYIVERHIGIPRRTQQCWEDWRVWTERVNTGAV